MKYYRKEKILDITDCDFQDLEHMEKSIAGSIATKFGFSTLIMTGDQISWYEDKSGNKDKKFKGKNILKGNRTKPIKVI